jgi:Mrp family chromosome partitioning ATPase
MAEPVAPPPVELVPANRRRAIVPLFEEGRSDVPAPLSDVIVNRHPLPHVLHPDLVMLTKPESPRAARFRALLHRLAERGDPRAILVTSARGREGKTFVATNLALALAELRRYRVLLVDGNVGRPELARRFGLERGQHACLLSQLEQHRQSPELPWRVTALGRCDLHLLAISLSTDRSRSLDGPGFAAAIERLREIYDYVIVDGPPVLDGPEVNLIEDSVAALLFAARAGHTSGRQLKAAYEQVSPTEILGVALLGA